MSRRKILLFIDSLGPGGAQNQLRILAKALKERGHVVEVARYYPMDFFGKDLRRAGIPIRELRKRTRLGWEVIRGLRGLYVRYRYDVVLSYLYTPNFYALAARLGLKRAPKVFIGYRSKTDFRRLSLWRKVLMQWSNRQADAIVSNAHHERLRWQRYQPSVSQKWRTIYNAVDLGEVRSHPAVLHRPVRLLVVGSVGADKNGLLIVDAMRILQSRGIDFTIDWVGAQYEERKRLRYRRTMDKRIKQYGLEQRWRWKGVTEAMVDEYLHHDALLIASEVEGLPNVLCEAMWLGMPCIVGCCLDHPRIIEDGIDGLLFPAGDARALALVVERFIQLTDEQRREMSRHAMAKARALFSPARMVDDYEQLLRELTL